MGDTNTNVDIEPATLEDINALVDQWVTLARDQRAYDSHLKTTENRTPVREELARHIVTDGVRVARPSESRGDTGDGTPSEELLGFVMYSLEYGQYEQTVTRGIVHNLYVVPNARGASVGSALLEAAEHQLTVAGAERIALDVMAANERGRGFYQRHGYRPHRVELEKPAQSDTHSKEDG